MTLSWRAHRAIDTDAAATYADGIASRIAIPNAVALMDGRVDDMVEVSEAALHTAQDELTRELGITVEGAAAASWAGLLAMPRPGGPALVIVTGSNT
jgi:threonine dehydratase